MVEPGLLLKEGKWEGRGAHWLATRLAWKAAAALEELAMPIRSGMCYVRIRTFSQLQGRLLGSEGGVIFRWRIVRTMPVRVLPGMERRWCIQTFELEKWRELGVFGGCRKGRSWEAFGEWGLQWRAEWQPWQTGMQAWREGGQLMCWLQACWGCKRRGQGCSWKWVSCALLGGPKTWFGFTIRCYNHEFHRDHVLSGIVTPKRTQMSLDMWGMLCVLISEKCTDTCECPVFIAFQRFRHGVFLPFIFIKLKFTYNKMHPY